MKRTLLGELEGEWPPAEWVDEPEGFREESAVLWVDI
jgi:hypothetical protein